MEKLSNSWLKHANGWEREKTQYGVCIQIVYDHSRNTFIGAHESMLFLLGLKFPHVFFAGFEEKYLLWQLCFLSMDLTWVQLVTSISDLWSQDSTALGRLVPIVIGYHQTLWGHLLHNNLNAPRFSSHRLYVSLSRNEFREGRRPRNALAGSLS